jgi:glycosyltransferase involved in cell wall biosynthesis
MNITALIITKNEEIHIERCINNIKKLVSDVLIIDSFSNDNTIEIAKKLNIKFIQNKFINHAKQFNFGLSQLSQDTDWVLKIDADEILTSSLIAEIKNKLPQLDKNINGIYIKRHLVFQDTLIKYGRLSPVRLLRLFRFQKGKCDNRWVDEKIKVEGKTVQFKEYIIDQNLKSLSEWIRKHDRYSSAEALNYLLIKYNSLFNNIEQSQLNFETLSVVSLKSRNLYAKLPLIIRAFIIFSYRYFFCLGFLHGKAGLIYFFLQSLWYRILVDAKILEVEKLIKKNTKIDLAIKEKLKVEVKNI